MVTGSRVRSQDLGMMQCNERLRTPGRVCWGVRRGKNTW